MSSEQNIASDNVNEEEDIWERFYKCAHSDLRYDKESDGLEYRCSKLSIKLRPGDCDKCASFKNQYLELPVTVNEIVQDDILARPICSKPGSIVFVNANKDKVVGIYISDIPVSLHTRYNEETKTLTNTAIHNPLIYIPERGELVYGYECFWGDASYSELLKYAQAHDDDDNVWYLQLSKCSNN